MRTLNGLLRFYNHAMYTLAIVSVLAILLTVSVQVAARYLFGTSFRWSEELSRYLLVWTTFIFAGNALTRGELMALELLSHLCGWKRRAIIVLGAVPALAALLVVTYYGYLYAQMNATQTSPTLGISAFYLYMALPVGSALLALHFIVQTAVAVRGQRNNEDIR